MQHTRTSQAALGWTPGLDTRLDTGTGGHWTGAAAEYKKIRQDPNTHKKRKPRRSALTEVATPWASPLCMPYSPASGTINLFSASSRLT